MLRQKVVHSLAWTFSSQVSREALQFVIAIVLARLLAPSDYGLVSISMTFLGFIQIFNGLGMRASLIHRQDIRQEHYTTAFWTTIVMSFSLCLATVMLAPYIAVFFNEPLLEKIIQVSALVFIVNSLNTVHFAILEKALDFKKITIVEISTAVLSGIISITLALTGYGVWALVLGGLAAQSILLPLPWIMTGWKPRFSYDYKAFKELFSFGANLTGAGILNYLVRNADNLIIGKVLGSTALGYYSLAYTLMLKPLQYVSANIGRVLFPAFSSIKDDKEKIRGVYLKVVQFISLITFPMMTGLLFVAPEFFEIAYGQKWMPAVPVFQILCLLGAIQSVGTTVGTIYLSQGRADLQFKYTLIFSPIFISSFFIGVNWGIEGVALCYALASGSIWVWSHIVANRLIDLRLRELFVRLVPAVTASLGMYLILSFIKYGQGFLDFDLPIEALLAEFVVLGAVSYLLFTYLLKADFFTEISAILRKRKSYV